MQKYYLSFAKDLAQAAGNVIRENFRLGMQKEWKSDATPLTESDVVINKMVVNAVRQVYRNHSVLSEEGDYLLKDSEYIWVCDPLDGTCPFSHGIPICTFSLALTHHGTVLLGVIYDPFMDRLFFAEKGKGAFLNDNPIRVSRQNNIKRALIGSVYWKNAPFDLSICINRLRDKQAQIIVFPSIAYMGALVASGEMTAILFPGDKPYDSAALKVIIEEAGGKITDVYGNDQRYDRPIRGCVASNGLLHDKLIASIVSTIDLN
jgi:myo-inositol-1(or 4)-monophosphatase